MIAHLLRAKRVVEQVDLLGCEQADIIHLVLDRIALLASVNVIKLCVQVCVRKICRITLKFACFHTETVQSNNAQQSRASTVVCEV